MTAIEKLQDLKSAKIALLLSCLCFAVAPLEVQYGKTKQHDSHNHYHDHDILVCNNDADNR